MKHKTRLLFKAILLCLIVFFAGCEKEPDFSETEKNLQGKVQIEKFSMPDDNSRLELNPLLVLKINEIKTKNLLAALPFGNTQFKFTFDEFDGLVFKIGTYQSYTFPVTRQNGDGKIENVVFSLNVEGKYDAYLVKYPFTKSELATMTLEKINKTLPQYIDLSRVSGIPNIICIDHQVATEVYEGDLDGNPTETQWVLFESFCGNVPTGGGPGGGFDGNVSTSPYTGGGYGGGGTSPTTQNQENIAKLNILTNSSVVKPKMQDLKERVPGTREYGYEFKKNSQNRLEASPLITGDDENGIQFPPIELNTTVRIHCHYNGSTPSAPEGLEPIPTFEDTYNFVKLFKYKKDHGATDANETTVIVVTELGNIALRITDPALVVEFLRKYNDKNEKLGQETFRQSVDNGYINTIDQAKADCARQGCSDEETKQYMQIRYASYVNTIFIGTKVYFAPHTTTNYSWTLLKN